MPSVNNIIYNKASKKEDSVPCIKEPEKFTDYLSVEVKTKISSLKE